MGKLLLALLVALAAACATTGSGAGGDASIAPKEGRALYEWGCQRCHALYMPTSFTAPEWSFYVRKYGRRARLTSEQKGLVFDYLAAHARPD